MSDLDSARTAQGRAVWPRALAAGVVSAVVIGGVVYALSEPARAVPMTICMAVVAFLLGGLAAWIGLVDRRSLPEATARPEESVEGHWYDRAVRGAFHDGLVVMGLGAFVWNVWSGAPVVDAAVLLPIILCAAVLDVAVRYQVQARR